MTDVCSPIGFFDSGLGGISVLKTAFELMSHENYLYYSDYKNAPYGEKSEDEIKELSLAAAKVLYDKGVKAIVVACNTATSASVKMMRDKFNIPVISMEPAVKPALDVDGKVLVLATPATVSQTRYKKLLERLDAGGKVINYGCSGLVEMIEEGRADKESIAGYFSGRLDFLKNEKLDAVVIGCTHYSFIENTIKDYLDSNYCSNCRVFDGRFGTARQLKRVLTEKDMLCSDEKMGSVEFITSGSQDLLGMYKKLFETF